MPMCVIIWKKMKSCDLCGLVEKIYDTKKAMQTWTKQVCRGPHRARVTTLLSLMEVAGDTGWWQWLVTFFWNTNDDLVTLHNQHGWHQHGRHQYGRLEETMQLRKNKQRKALDMQPRIKR